MIKLYTKKFVGSVNCLTLSVCLFSIIMTAQPIFSWSFTTPALQVSPVNGAFEFPLAQFGDGKIKHFEYKHAPNQAVRFFIVRSADGIFRAALDACEVCYRAKKGYVQDGDNVVCINCGLKFRTDKISQARGGCNPVPLKIKVQNGKILVNQNDVLSGLRYFR